MIFKPVRTWSLIRLVSTWILCFLIFGPITGVLLKGFSFEIKFERALILTSLITLFYGLQIYTWPKIKPTITDIFKNIRAPELSDNQRRGTLLLLTLLAFTIPFFASNYWLTIFILALIYVLLGLGLNIVVGLAGLLDLGFVAFYAVGAYGYALGNQYLGLDFWLALPLAAGLAGIFGMVLAFPVLRMHGDYLAIVTLGFGEIIRLVLNNWLTFTGGPNGTSAPLPTFMGIEFTRRAKYGGTTIHDFLGVDYSSTYKYIFLYLLLLLFCIGVIFFVNRLKKMPMGRVWEALREDEVACRSLGVNHVTVKLSAFSMGATIGGVAGVFFAAYQGFINPTSFTFFESALILAIVVLGGLGSTLGVVISAITLTIIPELLRDFSDYRVLVFGILMVVVMIWKPRGLLAIKRQMFPSEESKGHA